MISVIVCTRDRSESLRRTLSSLAQLQTPSGASWELLVVDNNSTDDTAEVVKTFSLSSSFPVRYVFASTKGLSHARNEGIRVARGDIIAFTDDDVTVDSRWLCELRRIFDQFGCMGIGGKIIPVWTSPKPSWLNLDGPDPLRSGTVVSFDRGQEPCELRNSPFGANMAFTRVAFEKHGMFRTDLGCGSPLSLGEDSEFGERLLAAGDKLVYAPDAIVYHPIPKRRLKKRHFQSHYFNYGRYMARKNGFPRDAILWFGVPRYLFRSLLPLICKWLFTFHSWRRFRHKLQFFEFLGGISETRRMSKDARWRVGALQRWPFESELRPLSPSAQNHYRTENTHQRKLS